MGMRRGTVATLLWGVVVVWAWWLLAPQAVGGTAAYVVVVGSSMEPTRSTGDLVVLRRAASYEVGEVAAFRSSDMADAVILHRIVGVDAVGRYLFSGDNNDFVDRYRPSEAQIIGREVLYVPGAGDWLPFLNQRWVVWLAVLLGLYLLITATLAPPPRRRRHGGACGRPVRS